MATGKPHVLVLTRTDDPSWPIDYEIEHPHCELKTWTDPGDEVTFTYYDCDVQYEVEAVGLECLAWHSEAVPGWIKPDDAQDWEDWKGLPEGRYIIQAWHSQDSWSGEWDGGVDLLGLEGEVEVAA